eukprot:jgi/Undpi1/10585/HiC_scaffold_29.g13035.m1
MDLGERGRLLPGSGSHRPEEDGEELRRRGQHDHWQYRSYGGLPVELGVVEEEDFRRIKLPAVTHFFRVALIASVLLIVAAMIANTVVRPSLPMRRGVLGGGPAGESSSTVPHGVPVEKLHGLERAEQQQDLVEGVRLTKYYTNHLCTPSRASLMTGRDTFRTGMQYEVVEDAAPWGLPLEETTLAERFKAAGYATHMSGKWHLGMFSEGHYPFNRGFDTFLGYMGGAEGYHDHVGCEEPDFLDQELVCFKDFGYGDHAGYINYTANTTRWGPKCQGTYSTTLITDRAIEVAATHKVQKGIEDPLFLYVAYQAVHDPVTPPSDDVFSDEEIATLERVASQDPWRKKFARVMFYLDKELRRLHDSLDALGLLDNAVMVLASDNGACPIRGGSNYPYRGFKHTLFEGGVRVPAFVYSKSPKLLPIEARGSAYDGMMHSTDWTPTLASIVPHLPLETMGLPLSGFDQWDAITGRRSEDVDGPVRRDLVLGMSSYKFDPPSHSMVSLKAPRGAFISDGWKVILGDRCTEWLSFNPGDVAKAKDLGCPKATLCMSCTSDCVDEAAYHNDFLFHIESDPFETVNLIDKMPDKFNDMVHMWKKASEDEVFSKYMPAESEALERWSEFNDWVVAWR